MASVLCVDDEVYIQELYQHMLPAGGFEVVATAYNGKEALATYTALEPKPDLVLMDQRMPIKSGVEATREILAMDPGACVIVISADASAREKAKAAGATAFVEKPFVMDDLFRLLRGCLGDGH
ncbi:MAG TPA: response regulator [Candidatus Thermoplasmatota archaeon]